MLSASSHSAQRAPASPKHYRLSLMYTWITNIFAPVFLQILKSKFIPMNEFRLTVSNTVLSVWKLLKATAVMHHQVCSVTCGKAISWVTKVFTVSALGMSFVVVPTTSIPLENFCGAVKQALGFRKGIQDMFFTGCKHILHGYFYKFNKEASKDTRVFLYTQVCSIHSITSKLLSPSFYQ